MVRLALVAALCSAPAIAGAERPAAVALGLGAGTEATPLGVRAVTAPVSIDAGASVAAPLWWHATASFGPGVLAGERGSGHTFTLRTGPRLETCWAQSTCLAAGAAIGWRHSRWTTTDMGATALDVTADALDLAVEGRAAVAIDPARRVFLAGFATAAATPARDAHLALSLGLELQVRN